MKSLSAILCSTLALDLFDRSSSARSPWSPQFVLSSTRCKNWMGELWRGTSREPLSEQVCHLSPVTFRARPDDIRSNSGSYHWLRFVGSLTFSWSSRSASRVGSREPGHPRHDAASSDKVRVVNVSSRRMCHDSSSFKRQNWAHARNIK